MRILLEGFTVPIQWVAGCARCLNGWQPTIERLGVHIAWLLQLKWLAVPTSRKAACPNWTNRNSRVRFRTYTARTCTNLFMQDDMHEVIVVFNKKVGPSLIKLHFTKHTIHVCKQRSLQLSSMRNIKRLGIHVATRELIRKSVCSAQIKSPSCLTIKPTLRWVVGDYCVYLCNNYVGLKGAVSLVWLKFRCDGHN